MGLKSTAPSAHVVAARVALLDALRPHADRLEIIEIVAVLSQTVGQFIAMLDQRQFTPAQAMQVVEENLAAGNAAQIEQVIGAPRGSA
jgi:hypothetical protein